MDLFGDEQETILELNVQLTPEGTGSQAGINNAEH